MKQGSNAHVLVSWIVTIGLIVVLSVIGGWLL